MNKQMVKFGCVALVLLTYICCYGADDTQPDTEAVLGRDAQIARLVAQANELFKKERALAKERRQCLERHNLSLADFQQLSDEQRQRIPGLAEKNEKLNQLKSQKRAVALKLAPLWGQEVKDGEVQEIFQE